MEKVDLVIKNVKVFNSYLKKFQRADVSVLGGKIFYVDTEQRFQTAAQEELDASGLYMVPGLIDIHMHIESSMMTPKAFGECVAGYGVTTIVSEPHEMANVKGIRGVHEMINAAKDAPIDIYYGIPSSVPSTKKELETTGGVIDFEDMKKLLVESDVICVGEIMNYRQIIKENKLEISRFLEYLKQEQPDFIVEGHCPSLVDEELAKFLYLGIDADHTEHTLEEVKQRMENGMFMELQDKMLKPEVLEYINENHLYEHCAFVTDDTMADRLYEEGQLNKVVEKAIKAGFPVEEAIYCATYTPARRMNLKDRGSIAPGRLADFILLSSPEIIEPVSVYKRGICIHGEKQQLKQSGSEEIDGIAYEFPADFYNSVCIGSLEPELFSVAVTEDVEAVTVRVIEVQEGQTQTSEKHVQMRVRNHQLQWEESGCLLMLVLERYGKNGNIGYGFVTGACIKEGAVSSTYFHDHHNLMVAGSNVQDMIAAASRVQAMHGGIAVAKDGQILSELPLPVGGILSDGTVKEIGLALKKVTDSLTALGYHHYNPVMSLCTLGLPVSPALKLTDVGLIDVIKGQRVPLIVKE